MNQAAITRSQTPEEGLTMASSMAGASKSLGKEPASMKSHFRPALFSPFHGWRLPSFSFSSPAAWGVAAVMVLVSLGGLAPTSVATAGVASACDAHPDQVDAYTNPPDPGNIGPQPPSPGSPAFLYIKGKSLIVPPKQTLMLSRSTTIKAETIDVWGAILTAPGVGTAGEGGAHLCLITSKLTVRPGGKIATGDGAKGVHKFSLDSTPAIPGGPGGKLHLVLKPSPNIPHPGMKVEPGGILKTGDGGPGGFHVSPRSAQGAPGGSGGNLHVVLPNTPSTFTVNPGGLVRSGDGGAGGYGVSLIPCEAERYATSLTVQKKASGNCIPIPRLPSCKNVQAAFQVEGETPIVCLSSGSSDCHDGVNLPPVKVGEILLHVGGESPQDCPDDPTDPGSPADPGRPPEKGECNPLGGLFSTLGGTGGDAGIMDFWQEATPSWLVADGSLHIGEGGAGGSAYTIGDGMGESTATGGAGGGSLLNVNGLSAIDDSTAASWFSSRIDAFAGGKGGNGGNAAARPLNYCALKCDPSPEELVASDSPQACGKGLMPEPCDRDPVFNALYCVLFFLNNTLPYDVNWLCQATAAEPCFGAPGAPDNKVGDAGTPGYPGEHGRDASPGFSGGFGVSCGVGCGGGITIGCAIPAPDATPGDDGGPGGPASRAIATGKKGGPGVLLGGRGGDAYAKGLNGGPGGPGGWGGDGSQTCYHAAKAPAAGGPGGAGGAGGNAEAYGGPGGKSTVQGGAGGNADAKAGNGGSGGSGGKGGDGAPYRDCSNSWDPRLPGQCHTEYEQGASGGQGGVGGAAGHAQAAVGAGGEAPVDGPPGLIATENGGQVGPPGPPGAHGQRP